MLEVIRRVFSQCDYKPTITDICVFRHCITWLKDAFKDVETWLHEMASYDNDGSLRPRDGQKFWAYCVEIKQTQEYVRTKESPCGKCDACLADSLEEEFFYLDLQPNQLLTCSLNSLFQGETQKQTAYVGGGGWLIE